MLKGFLVSGALACALAGGSSRAAEPSPSPIHWQSWSGDAFAQARREKKLVLLDLQAVWCHWCHVMEITTYRDPKVIQLMHDHYVALSEDRDNRLDLAAQYEEYGWPATVIYDGRGRELAKLAGYLTPERMESLLQAFADDPTPGPSTKGEPAIQYAKSSRMTDAIRRELVENVVAHADFKDGAYTDGRKRVDRSQMEWALTSPPDPKMTALARVTFQRGLELVDQAWGGLFQYSAEGDWEHPHFEKVMSVQADGIIAYLEAAGALKRPEYLQTAVGIADYLHRFLLSPDGAFYASQDADLVDGEHAGSYFRLGDKERRAQGIPRVDQHLYARENGWAIRALLALYSVTGDPGYLAHAMKAMDWVIGHRSLGAGGFSHDDPAEAGAKAEPYLGDTLAMAAACLEVYTNTGDRAWLKQAEQSMGFIDGTFKGGAPAGYVSFKGEPKARGAFAPKPNGAENLELARLANRMSQATGNPLYARMIDRAMRFLLSPRIRSDLILAPGLLRLDRELTTQPVHITVVGPKSDEKAKRLFRAALAYPAPYRRIEWYDPKEGNLPNQDVTYPSLPQPAAFACSDHKCSLPAFAPEQIRQRVDLLLR